MDLRRGMWLTVGVSHTHKSSRSIHIRIRTPEVNQQGWIWSTLDLHTAALRPTRLSDTHTHTIALLTSTVMTNDLDVTPKDDDYQSSNICGMLNIVSSCTKENSTAVYSRVLQISHSPIQHVWQLLSIVQYVRRWVTSHYHDGYHGYACSVSQLQREVVPRNLHFSICGPDPWSHTLVHLA